MKLTTTVACLMLITAPLLAQFPARADGPAPADGPGMGMHHYGGPGMRGPGFGTGDHLVQPISNVPVTAQFTSTTNRTTRDGKQVTRSGTEYVYRDSLGRTRQDITLPPPPPLPPSGPTASAPPTPSAPRTMTVILDPVANTVTRLDANRKLAIVQTVPANFFKRAQDNAQTNGQTSAQPLPAAPSSDSGTTDLGSKTIAGVPAKGKRITHTRAAHDGESAHTMTYEVWTSPDLRIEVSRTETTDRGTRTNTLSALTKAEPDASLFKVPGGYTVQNAAGHSSYQGGHRDPGPDGTVPPPPGL